MTAAAVRSSIHASDQPHMMPVMAAVNGLGTVFPHQREAVTERVESERVALYRDDVGDLARWMDGSVSGGF